MEKKDVVQVFAQNLYRKRKAMNLTQEALAEIFGIGQQSLSRMERGAMAPKFERLSDIANALHCTVADLFTDRCDNHFCVDTVMSNILNELRDDERSVILNFLMRVTFMLKNTR